MHLSLILSVMAKAVNTYVHVIFFSFFIFNKLAKISKQTSFTLSLWGIVFRILWKIIESILEQGCNIPNLEKVKRCEYVPDALYTGVVCWWKTRACVLHVLLDVEILKEVWARY